MYPHLPLSEAGYLAQVGQDFSYHSLWYSGACQDFGFHCGHSSDSVIHTFFLTHSNSIEDQWSVQRPPRPLELQNPDEDDGDGYGDGSSYPLQKKACSSNLFSLLFATFFFLSCSCCGLHCLFLYDLGLAFQFLYFCSSIYIDKNAHGFEFSHEHSILAC